MFRISQIRRHSSRGARAYPAPKRAVVLACLCAAIAHAAIKISPAALPDWTVNSPYSQNLTASGCSGICTWSFTGSLPPGLSLAILNGSLSGIPTRAGSFGFTVTATDTLGANASQVYTIVINPSPSITTATLANGTVGVAYSQTIAATGGTPPYSLSLTSGTLPAGLTLDRASGEIKGTPGAAGASNFTVQVMDHAQATASQPFTLTIAAAAQSLTITTTSPLPGGATDAAYSQTLAASGGTPPYTWSVSSGALPAGISLNSSNGLLAGTPTASGTFQFTTQVTDSGTGKASKAFALTITAATSNLAITTTAPLPGASVGSAYSQTLTATGGKPPYSWSVTTGALPDGLSLNSNSGLISGTPTATGSFTFNARVTDSASAPANQLLSINVGPASATPSLTITGIPANTNSAAQVPFDVVLSSVYTRTVTGQVTLTFQPSVTVSRDDPAVQFASGSRSVNFTIPAGSTHATFSANPAAFQTGTVAGTIKLTVTSDLPGGATASSAAVVPAAAPVISSATIVTNSSGFQIQVSGFSNSRELAGASFHFTAKSGQSVQTSDLSVNLSSLASQWYTGTASNPFGGEFLLVVPFTVQQGGSSGLASVSVQLQNSQAASLAATANFQ